MFELSGLALGAVPVVVALVQIAKGLGLTTRYAPLLSLVLGVGILLALGEPWLAGIIVGLSASGLYSGGKTAFK